MNNLLIPPHSVCILLTNGKAGDTHVIRDVIDDKRAEPSVAEKREGESYIDEDRRVLL